MKVCTKKIRPLARRTNHHYQRYLFSLYEKKTGKQYVDVRLFVYVYPKQSMEMPQGALPKKRRPNEVRSKGKQYKDHVYHTEYFWMENCLHVWSWVCFLAKMIWNFEYLVMVKNGCAMLIALTRTTASSTAMAVAVTSPLKMIFYAWYFRRVQSAKFTHLTRRWLTLILLNKRHFTLSSYKPWQCYEGFRRMGRIASSKSSLNWSMRGKQLILWRLIIVRAGLWMGTIPGLVRWFERYECDGSHFGVPS